MGVGSKPPGRKSPDDLTSVLGCRSRGESDVVPHSTRARLRHFPQSEFDHAGRSGGTLTGATLAWCLRTATASFGPDRWPDDSTDQLRPSAAPGRRRLHQRRRRCCHGPSAPGAPGRRPSLAETLAQPRPGERPAPTVISSLATLLKQHRLSLSLAGERGRVGGRVAERVERWSKA